MKTVKCWGWIIFLLFCCCSLPGASKKEAAGWKCNNGVNPLFATPMGIVYQIAPTTAKNNGHSSKCACQECFAFRNIITGGFLSYSLNPKQKKQFLVIEFKIRAYPALEQAKTSRIRFQFFTASGSKMTDRYPSASEIFSIHHNGVERFSPGVFFTPNRFLPDFEPMAIRIVIDQTKPEISFQINGHEHKVKAGVDCRHFGIMCSLREENRENLAYRQNYLEISPPVIRHCSTEKELRLLPSNHLERYPYEEYEVGRKKKKKNKDVFREVKRDKNPDLQYAYALRYLYDPEMRDPEKAVELLTDAVRKKHVLAYYLLGICHWRGYGVEPDPDRALFYFEKAGEYEFQEALAGQWLLLWNQAGRPGYETAELKKIQEKLRKSAQKNLTTGYVAGFQKSIVYPQAEVPIFSEKNLISGAMRRSFVAAENGNLAWIDAVCAKGFLPAIPLKAFDLLKEGKMQEAMNLLEKTGKLQAGIGYPEYLLAKKLQGTLSIRDFSDRMNCRFASDPLYLLLLQSCRDVEVDKVLKRDFQRMRNLSDVPFLENVPPEKMSAAEKTVYYFRTRIGSRYNGFPNERIIPWKNIFQILTSIVREKQDPVMQFCLGWHYYFNNFPTRASALMKKPSRMDEAISLFDQSAKGGFLPARLFLAKARLKKDPESYLSVSGILKPLVAAKHPEALLLLARSLYQVKRYREAIVRAREAAKLGEHRGWLVAALAQKKSGSRGENRDWKQYVEADLDHRAGDRYDPCMIPSRYEMGKWDSALEISRKLSADEMLPHWEKMLKTLGINQMTFLVENASADRTVYSTYLTVWKRAIPSGSRGAAGNSESFPCSEERVEKLKKALRLTRILLKQDPLLRCMKIPVPERKVTVLCYEFEHWVVLELPSFQIPSRDWKEVRRTLEELYGKNAVWEKVRKLGHSSLSSLSANDLRGE